MGAPYKMKGSPMARNFGVGSPLHDHKKDKDGNVIKHPKLPVSHSDTTTEGNPLTPSMIDFLGRQGFTKAEINTLHKAHERKLKK
jgi:hypothetical protein